MRVLFCPIQAKTLKKQGICTWIFNNTGGSLLPVMLWHASTDAMTYTETYLFHRPGDSLPGHAVGDWILWPIVAIVIIWLTRGRLGYHGDGKEANADDVGNTVWRITPDTATAGRK